MPATDVLRQKRNRDGPKGTMMVSARKASTWNMVPVSAFSGLPPSEGGLKLGSRHVPVYWLEGAILAAACVSL